LGGGGRQMSGGGDAGEICSVKRRQHHCDRIVTASNNADAGTGENRRHANAEGSSRWRLRLPGELLGHDALLASAPEPPAFLDKSVELLTCLDRSASVSGSLRSITSYHQRRRRKKKRR